MLRACLEVAFGDKKCQFFDETIYPEFTSGRHFLKFIPLGTDEKSNAVSSKKGYFLAQWVTSKQALIIPGFGKTQCQVGNLKKRNDRVIKKDKIRH